MMTKEDYLNEYKTHKSMRDNVKRDNYRLQYHLMPPTGFLNDPNGLFQKDGVYHIYFQYTPFTKSISNFNNKSPFLTSWSTSTNVSNPSPSILTVSIPQ